MEEMEDPTERLQEDVHHLAQHSDERWIGRVALSSAILAVFAAISALLSGHHSNEAMLSQIQASNQWAYYQSKGIKSAVLSSKIELLTQQGKALGPKDEEKVQKYKEEQESISEKAKDLEKESEKHLQSHLNFARAVTLFQVAIALSAICILTRRKKFWAVSIGLGSFGILFILAELLHR